MSIVVTHNTPADGSFSTDGETAWEENHSLVADGYIPEVQFIRAASTVTLPNDTNTNKLFNSPTNGRLTLGTGTYRISGIIYLLSMSGSSGNGTLDLLGAGTATVGDALIHFVGVDQSNPLAPTARTGSGTATLTSGTSVMSNGTGTGLIVEINGIFRITSGGTIIPSFKLTHASAAVVQVNSHVIVERMGSDSVVSVGAWD
jgi:hypothetical protein